MCCLDLAGQVHSTVACSLRLLSMVSIPTEQVFSVPWRGNGEGIEQGCVVMQLLETACSLVVEQMVTRLKRLTQRMAEHEDFEIIATSHKAGAAFREMAAVCSCYQTRPS